MFEGSRIRHDGVGSVLGRHPSRESGRYVLEACTVADSRVGVALPKVDASAGGTPPSEYQDLCKRRLIDVAGRQIHDVEPAELLTLPLAVGDHGKKTPVV